MCVDECVGNGLSLAKFTEETKAKLRAGLIPESYVENPVDVAATANADHFGLAISCLNEDPGVDAILIPMVTPFFVDCEAIARRIAETAKTVTKPIIAVVMTNENWASTVETIKSAGIPVFDFPETGARVLAAMARYSEIRKHLTETPAIAAGKKAKAQEILAGAGEGFIPQAAAFKVLEAYDIPVARTVEITAAELPRQDEIPRGAEGGQRGCRPQKRCRAAWCWISPGKAALQKAMDEMSGRFPGARLVVQEQCARRGLRSSSASNAKRA